MQLSLERAELGRTFGSRLKELCRTHGWSLRELSRRTTIGSHRLSRLGRGLSLPKYEELLELRRVFAMGLEELVFGVPSDPEGIQELVRRLIETASQEEETSLRFLLRALLDGLRRGLARGSGS
jgi:transcriptional regulator with XRE-family HTH domain